MSAPSLSQLLQANHDPNQRTGTLAPAHVGAPHGQLNFSEPPSHSPAALPPLNTPDGTPQHHRQPSTTATPGSHSSTQSLYQCADCKRRYSRPEHLARHIQTHTLGKRFSCQVCGKAFARADLLKRHAANHENDDGKKRRRTSPSTSRVSHACRPCAAARVKCEEVKPCTRCRNRGIQCDYPMADAGSSNAMHGGHMPAMKVEPTGNNSSVPPETPMTVDSNPPPDMIVARGPTRPCSVMGPAGHDQRDSHDAQQFTNATGSVEVANPPFYTLLRDVLYEQQNWDATRFAGSQDISLGATVLDYCDNVNYDMNDVDFGLLGNWGVDGVNERHSVLQSMTPQTDDSTVDMSEMRQKLVKIWTESPWRWVPDTRDHSHGEYGNLPLHVKGTTRQHLHESQQRYDRVTEEKVDQSARDQILSIVLSTCRTDTEKMLVATSFPLVDVLDTLTHIFLAAHLCSVSSWIHFGTLALNGLSPEFIATAAAYGAVMTPIPLLRKFGFAVQEAVRIAIPSRFETNNVGISNIGLVQAVVIGQDIGLWSGNRRKMEIAECHLLIPITMMRYRGRFQRSSYPVITVKPEDEGQVLEDKWRQWCDRESWKRLVFHCYLRDAESSMTTLAHPTVSYAELSLPLPEAKELWFARNAVEWKQQVLMRTAASGTKQLPCLGDIIRDVHLLTANRGRLDTRYAISIYLHAIWNLVFEWRQLSAVHKLNTFQVNYQAGPSLILSSRHQELCKALSSFQLVTADWHTSLSAQESLLLNLLFMNLYVSVNDLQVFAGKEGEDQARRIYPVLQEWSESTEARQAVWYAGQVLRQAKMFPPGHLKDISAVALHHAALTLWTYSVVLKASRNQPVGQGDPSEKVYVDGVESIQIQNYIGYSRGHPVLRGPQSEVEASLDDPRACMSAAEAILRANFSGSQELLPPLVENLCHLITQLGGAAHAVGLV